MAAKPPLATFLPFLDGIGTQGRVPRSGSRDHEGVAKGDSVAFPLIYPFLNKWPLTKGLGEGMRISQQGRQSRPWRLSVIPG